MLFRSPLNFDLNAESASILVDGGFELSGGRGPQGKIRKDIDSNNAA
jgi:hypothetical protein